MDTLRITATPAGRTPMSFYARAVHRWDRDGQANITRYYRNLMARPSVARVVDDARPWRGVFPVPWPADIDELGP